MKLITFQSMDALDYLLTNGYLICDDSKIEKDKYGIPYEFIISKMNERVDNKDNIKYPIWCWVKCYNGICPPKVKCKNDVDFKVKITFHKEEKEVFITDYRRYSFVLNNEYIASSLKERKAFEKELEEKNITREDLKAYVRRDKYKNYRKDKTFKEICDKIKLSFDKCITKDSNILQGCVWKINLDDIEKIEIIKDSEYVYGNLNYIRKNGERMNWIEDYYKRIK